MLRRSIIRVPVRDDQVVHRRGGFRGHDGKRILRIRAQAQHQRVDDALDGATERAAVVAAEYLNAGTDCPPRLLDHRPPWVARYGPSDVGRHM